MAVSTIGRPFPFDVMQPFSYVRNGSGTTEVITTTSGTRAVLFLIDSNTANCGVLYIVSTGSNAATYAKIGGLSGVTVSATNSTVTITHASGVPLYRGFIAMGSISITAS